MTNTYEVWLKIEQIHSIVNRELEALGYFRYKGSELDLTGHWQQCLQILRQKIQNDFT